MVKVLEPIVTNIEYYLPKIDYSNSLIANNKNSISSIIKKIGIDKKYSAANEEYATDLAIKACEKLFQNDKELRNKIDFIIYCSQSIEHTLPAGSSLIQDRLFSGKNIGAIDINLGCSGFVYSLSIAKGMVVSNVAKCVLIITAETYSKFISDKNTSVRTIFGDGSCATVVESSISKNCGIMTADLGTDGSGSLDLIVPGSGLKPTSYVKKNINPIYQNKIVSNELFMNGTKMFTFAMKSVPLTIQNVLEINKLNIEDIDMYILHQANAFMLESIRKKLGIDIDKFIIELAGFGNTTSSTIPIALKNAIKKNKIREDMKVLICGFGVGYSWATNIININKILVDNIKK